MSITIDVDKIIGHELPSFKQSYTERDVILYALAVGAGRNPIDQQQLRFVYELHSEGLQVLPTFAVSFLSYELFELPGLDFNPMMLLHGEHYLEVIKPLPTQGDFTSKAHISQVYDKGSGMVVMMDTVTSDSTGRQVAFNQSSVFIRGLGGFGGERGPSSKGVNEPPERAPDAVVEDVTRPEQALLYRLVAGDRNPLHADPAMAALGNFDRPILHGLCTFGFAARAVLERFADGDPARFKSIKVRFARHVFPGETLITEMWQEGENRILFKTKVKERDEYAITNAAVELQ